LSSVRIDIAKAAHLVRTAEVRGQASEPSSDTPQRSDGGEPPPLLTAHGVTKYFPLPGGGGRRRAVAGVSLELGVGQKLGIVGESGSGKSTLARLLLGLIAPDEGAVEVSGQRWDGASGAQLRGLRRAVQFISQDSVGSFDPRYTVHEVIAEPLRGVLSPAAASRRVGDLLDLVGLHSSLAPASPRTLSGGQAQRVAIARSLALGPDVIICDEPVSALDVSIQAQVLDLLCELTAATETALVFISHDLGVVHHLVNQVLVMSNGYVVEQGDVDEVFANPLHPYTRALIAAIPELPTPRLTLHQTPQPKGENQ
jgi:peptide/nickel transport system ATP-binding protein